MRHSSSVTRLGPRAVTVGMFAAFASFAWLACGIAAANTITTTFEAPAFNPGSVAGQNGWRSAVPGNVPGLPLGYDQEVEQNAGAPPAFEAQSLRLSNRFANGEFLYQTYSAPVAPAGETQANTEFSAEFSFISKTPGAEQPGLNVSVSPDSGEGSRMSYVSLKDTPEGIRATVFDSPEADGGFAAYDAGTLNRAVPHTIRFEIKLNPGADDDLMRVFIDGRDLGQCFTTWENYYHAIPAGTPPPNVTTPATINSLEFRSSVPGFAGVDGGYLFDNVTTTSAPGGGPRGCDDVIEKTADTRTVRAGGLARYQITVRNRGAGSDRNVQVCDRIPRRMTFVRADRTLRRVGGRRCLVIARLAPGQRVSTHITFRVNANAPAGRVANIADVTPGVEPPGSPPAPAADLAPPGLPAAPGGSVPRVVAAGARVPDRRARAIVRVLARRIRPNFTG